MIGEPVARRRGGAVGRVVLRGGKALLTAVSVAVLALAWYGWQFVGDLNEGLATTNVFDGEPKAKPLDGAIDILLVGLDSRTDAHGNPLPREVLDMLHAGKADGERQTDTMILVHIPQDGTRAVAVSFPRDTWVELAGGYGRHKLNSAFVYAYNDKHQTLLAQGETDLRKVQRQATLAGRKNLIATVEQLIGRPGMIDRYAEVNLASFYEITKAIGGIEVCLKEPVQEYRSGIDLPAGRQTVEGVQALAFVRQRYELPNGDLDRIARQQAFLSGLARKVLSTDVLTSPSKLNELVAAVKKSVVLSEQWDLWEFAAQMRGLTGGNIEFHTIPVVGDARIGGAYVLRIDVARVRSFVASLVGEPEPAPDDTVSGAADITVTVYDGSGGSGLGRQVRDLLTDSGFAGTGVTRTAARSTTVVRHAPGDTATLTAIRQALGEVEVAAEPDPDVPTGQARVLVGRDFRPTTAASPSNAAGQRNPAPAASSGPGSASTSAAPPAAPPITAGGVPCVN
nr:LCP family protein [Amycolatopsis arida]